MKIQKMILFFLLGGTVPAGAAGEKEYSLTVQPTIGGDVSSAPATGIVTRSGEGTFVIRLHNTCYGTNLRNVPTPLHPNSILTTSFSASINGVQHKIRLSYPASIVTPTGVVIGSDGNKAANAARALLRQQMSGKSGIPAFELTAEALEAPAGSRGAVYGNVAQIEIPASGVFEVDASGKIKRTGKLPSVSNIRFSQQMPAQSNQHPLLSNFIGFKNTLSGSVDAIALASDGSSMDINLSFPGAIGFCGGYKSPLMLFFNEDRPLFTGTSEFPIHPGKKTYWPEASSPGYFLVLDRNKDGRIDQREELFGDQDKGGSNGFVELAKFDRNKDKIIDKKDPVYNRLRLWNDADGDGKATPRELKTLREMRVESISLDYDGAFVRPIGQGAEERQKSTFQFKSKEGLMQTGVIVDVWLKTP